jgi:signal transduction histidine kinase
LRRLPRISALLTLVRAACRMNVDAKPGRYVFVGVIDTGVGIADQNLNKIFDPYTAEALKEE